MDGVVADTSLLVHHKWCNAVSPEYLHGMMHDA